LARPRCGRRFDRVGRVFADALTAAERDWLSGRRWRTRMTDHGVVLDDTLMAIRR
jgi:hypothetical protein